MSFRLTFYFLKQALGNILNNRVVHLVGAGTVTVSMLMFGAFLLLYVNLNGWVQGWGRTLTLSVYLAEEVDEIQRDRIAERLRSLPGAEIDRLHLEGACLGGTAGRARRAGEPLEGLSRNPLPASFEVTLSNADARTSDYRALCRRIEELEGVDEVQYGEEWVNRFEGFMRLFPSDRFHHRRIALRGDPLHRHEYDQADDLRAAGRDPGHEAGGGHGLVRPRPLSHRGGHPGAVQRSRRGGLALCRISDRRLQEAPAADVCPAGVLVHSFPLTFFRSCCSAASSPCWAVFWPSVISSSHETEGLAGFAGVLLGDRGAVPGGGPVRRGDPDVAPTTAAARDQIELIESQLAEQKENLQTTHRQERDLLGELASLEEEVQRKRGAVTDLEKGILRMEGELEVLRRNLSGLERRHLNLQEQIGFRLRALYKYARQGYLQAVLASTDAQELRRRFKYVQCVTEEDGAALGRLGEQREEVSRKLLSVRGAVEKTGRDLEAGRGVSPR